MLGKHFWFARNNYENCKAILQTKTTIAQPSSLPHLLSASPEFTVVPDENVIAFTDQTTELKCGVKGYPKPTVLWKRSGDVPLPFGRYRIRGTNLYLTKPEPRDAGRYSCVAATPAGSIVAITSVTVLKFGEALEVLSPLWPSVGSVDCTSVVQQTLWSSSRLIRLCQIELNCKKEHIKIKWLTRFQY